MLMKTKKLFFTAAMLMAASSAMAQWRIGATVGAANNKLGIDTQYQYDWRYDSRWGVQFGVNGQYDFNDWFGVRAELDFQQRGYTMRRTEHLVSLINYKYRDNYLTLPVMASFSFGGEKVRGFLNVGVYGGYWLNSHVKGSDVDIDYDMEVPVDASVSLDSRRDQRFDFGYVGGVGVEYRFAEHWAAQVEARYYYSVVSKKKQYQASKDYQYNNTLSLTGGISYIF